MTLLTQLIINSSNDELYALLENYKSTLNREIQVLIKQELLERNY